MLSSHARGNLQHSNFGGHVTNASEHSDVISGWDRAILYRSELLRILGAESGVLESAGKQRVVSFQATGLTTFFTLETPADETPFHSPFNIRTFIAAVTDLAAARNHVNELNTYTSLIRWLIVSREGADVSFDAGVEFEFFVVADYSTMLGNPVTEVPFRLAEMILREQITRAWLLVSHGFIDGWGVPVHLESTPVDPEGADANANYFDLVVTPYSNSDATKILHAAEVAFDREVQAQLSVGEPGWVGFHGLTFEVPYGLGDFRGAVTHLSNEGDESNDTSTGLVRASTTTHPHFGNGLVCWLQIPAIGFDDVFALVEALNRQNSPSSAGFAPPFSMPHFSHSIGAWVVRGDDIAWAAFIPAAFGEIFEPETLIDSFREMWQDTARMAFAAHAVLNWEDFKSVGCDGRLGLLSPSEAARGGAYGEFGGGDMWFPENAKPTDE